MHTPRLPKLCAKHSCVVSPPLPPAMRTVLGHLLVQLLQLGLQVLQVLPASTACRLKVVQPQLLGAPSCRRQTGNPSCICTHFTLHPT